MAQSKTQTVQELQQVLYQVFKNRLNTCYKTFTLRKPNTMWPEHNDHWVEFEQSLHINYHV